MGAIEGLDGMRSSNQRESTSIMQLLRDNVTLWAFHMEEMMNPDAERDDDYNDGIDIMKYGKRVMAQNTEDPVSEKDKLRNGLIEVFEEVTNDKMYKEVIEVILEYEAYINLSKFRCIECNNYFGSDVFEYRCSQCFEEVHGVEERKRLCKE